MIKLLTLLCVCLLLTLSCTLEENVSLKDWKPRGMTSSYVFVPKDMVGTEGNVKIMQLKSLYKKKPHLDYEVLLFSELRYDVLKKEEYYLFLITEDLEVVFVVNDKGQVVDNFLLSAWGGGWGYSNPEIKN